MAVDDYAVIYTGSLQAGLTRDQVAHKLAELFKQREEKLARILERSSVVLKRGLSRENAERYAGAFIEAGMQVVVKSARNEPEAGEGTVTSLKISAPPRPAAAEAGAARAGAATLDAGSLPESASPEDTAARHPVKPPLDPEVLVGLIKGKLTPVNLGAGYRLGLIGVAFTMVLLPALYVAICAGVGYFLVWWFSNGWNVTDLGGYYARGLIYLLPLMMAAVLFFFMLKPLVAGARHQETALILTPGDQPLLFAFVNALCDRVGARRPRRVQVDCNVNASASFTGGIAGLIAGRLTLTLGTPLLAGMSTRQLAGVLAHEFGHFSQGAGMTATFLIRGVTFWFYRAVYSRDAWDERLARYADNAGGGWLELGLMGAQGCVWLVRKILERLLILGELVSRFMLRHMEFDADTYEAQIAGSAQFRDTSVRLRLLAVAHQSVHQDLGALWEDGKLVDDIPSAVSDKADAIEEAFNQQVEAMLEEEQTNYFDTHPADGERIRRAESLNAPGMFRLELPASVLIEDFEALAKQSTRRYYTAELGISPSEQGLVDRASMQAATQEAKARDEALEAYARDLFMPERFIEPAAVKPYLDHDDEARKQKLEECVGRLRASLPDITAVVELVRRLDTELTGALVQSTVGQSGVKTREIMTIKGELSKACKKLKAFEDVLVERLAVGLAGWVNKLQEGDAQLKQFDQLMRAQMGFADLQKPYDELHVSAMKLYRTLEVMESTYDAARGTSAVPPEILRERIAEVESGCDRMGDALEKIDYPFDRAGGPADIRAHLMDSLPVFDGDNPGGVVDYAMQLNQAITRLHVRVMAALCHRAQEIETELGVAPIRIKLATD